MGNNLLPAVARAMVKSWNIGKHSNCVKGGVGSAIGCQQTNSAAVITEVEGLFCTLVQGCSWEHEEALWLGNTVAELGIAISHHIWDLLLLLSQCQTALKSRDGQLFCARHGA